MVADRLGVSTGNIDFWLTPWSRTDEHLPMSHIAEVGHTRGFFWDSISVESSGGLNPLVIEGPPKSQARIFVAHVRERMNDAPSRHAAAAATSPLKVRPCLPAEITTFSPSLMRPERISSASGSCTDFWITRLSGRAP